MRQMQQRIISSNPETQRLLDEGVNAVALPFRMLSPARWKQLADDLDGGRIPADEKQLSARVYIGQYLNASLFMENRRRQKERKTPKMNLMQVCRHLVEDGLIRQILDGRFFEDPETGGSLNDFDRILTHAGFGGEKNASITITLLRNWSYEADVPSPQYVRLNEFMTPEEYVSIARDGCIDGMPKSRLGMRNYLEGLADNLPSGERRKMVRNARSQTVSGGR